MTIAVNPPATTERVIELLAAGTTTTQTARQTGWPRDRILALINGRKGWLLSPATDTVYCPDDADPIEDPGHNGLRAKPAAVTAAEKPETKTAHSEVTDLLTRAQAMDDTAVSRALERVHAGLERLREAVAEVDRRAELEAEREQALAAIAEAEERLAAAKARAKELGAVGRRKQVKAAAVEAQAKTSYSAVRKWAAENGVEVNARGAVPRHVIERYEAAQKAGS